MHGPNPPSPPGRGVRSGARLSRTVDVYQRRRNSKTADLRRRRGKDRHAGVPTTAAPATPEALQQRGRAAGRGADFATNRIGGDTIPNVSAPDLAKFYTDTKSARCEPGARFRQPTAQPDDTPGSGSFTTKSLDYTAASSGFSCGPGGCVACSKSSGWFASSSTGGCTIAPSGPIRGVTSSIATNRCANAGPGSGSFTTCSGSTTSTTTSNPCCSNSTNSTTTCSPGIGSTTKSLGSAFATNRCANAGHAL